MKTYEDKLLENERATTRWMVRLKRASNKLEKLRRQRVTMLRAQAKSITKEADSTEKSTVEGAIVVAALSTPPPKPKKRGKPERRINL